MKTSSFVTEVCTAGINQPRAMPMRLQPKDHTHGYLEAPTLSTIGRASYAHEGEGRRLPLGDPRVEVGFERALDLSRLNGRRRARRRC